MIFDAKTLQIKLIYARRRLMSFICINKQIADKARYIAAATHTAPLPFQHKMYGLLFLLLVFSVLFFLICNRLFFVFWLLYCYQVNHATSGISRFLSQSHISPIIFSNKEFTKTQTNSICFLLVFDFWHRLPLLALYKLS